MLTPDQISFYNENGYLLIKGLFSKEDSAHYRSECHALADRLTDADATWESARDAVHRIRRQRSSAGNAASDCRRQMRSLSRLHQRLT